MKQHRPESDEVPAFISRLMPNANDAELQSAHQTVKDYIDIVIRIFERAAGEKLLADSQESEARSRIRTE